MASNGRKNARDNSRAGFEKREKRRQIRALQEAIDRNEIETVKQILESEFDVDFQYRGQTALQLAVRKGHLEICRLLIGRGADVNMADAELNNLLNMACWRGYTEIASILVQHGADKDHQNIHGFTPIHTAGSKGYSDIVQILLSADSVCDIADKHGHTPLHTATLLENTEVAQLLVLGGCSVNRGDEERKSPIILAAEMGFVDILKILIAGESDLNCQDRTGCTALCHCAGKGHTDIARELILAGADINLPTTRGVTPLLESINCGHIQIALLLIESGCNIDQADRLQQAPIHAAVRQVTQYFSEDIANSMTVIRKLVEAGCDINKPDQDLQTPLYQSASGGNLELTKYLLSKKADLTMMTKTGDTVLHAGVYGNSTEIVKLLIEAGCSTNEANQAGEHPLMTSVVLHSHIEVVKSLIDAGCDLNHCEKNQKMSSLHKAILHHYTEAAILLVDSGCDINARDCKQQTPLYLACEKGNEEVVKHLLAQTHLSRKVSKLSAIPLHAAVANGHAHLVDTMIQAGFDINQMNDKGLTLLQHAVQENYPLVAKVLLKYNCDLDAHAKIKRLMKCCLLHEDRHPHFDLEPCFLALTHKNVELLRLFVKTYYELPYRKLKALQTVFATAPELNTHFTPEQKKEIIQLFQETLKNPRKLQELCRARIRERLKSCPHLTVDKLPLAERIKDYVLMEELFGSLDETIAEDEATHPVDLHLFKSVVDL